MHVTPSTEPKRRGRVTGTKPMALSECTRYHYDRHPDDLEAAIDTCMEYLDRRPGLLREAAELYVKAAIRSHIPLADNKLKRQGVHIQHATPVSSPASTGFRPASSAFMGAMRDAIKGHGKATQDALFEVTYGIDGRRVALGDMTGAQIDIVAAEKSGRISSEYRDMMFLRRLRDRVALDKRVADCLTVEEARGIKAEAESLDDL